MMHAVEHDLRDGPLAVAALARGLIIDGLGEAGERAVAVVGAGFEHELGRRRVGPLDERPLGILLGRFLRRQRPQQVGRREVERLRCAGGSLVRALVGLP